MTRALIVFVKNPVLGKVKTRLAADTSDAFALEIYERLLRHTADVTRRVSADLLLFHSESIEPLPGWEHAVSNHVQSGEDLGDKMHAAFESILSKYESAILIGSDCGDLNEDHIARGFGYLENTSHVIGPAVDGGYYLIGMRAPNGVLFENMPWSTSDVCRETISRILSAGDGLAILPELRDVDTLDDLRHLGWT